MSERDCDDPLIAAMDKAAPFSDRSWTRADGLRPSQIIVFRYLNLVTAGEKGHAERIARDWLAQQRADYRAARQPLPTPDSNVEGGEA